jgi:hypothetical protein
MKLRKHAAAIGVSMALAMGFVTATISAQAPSQGGERKANAATSKWTVPRTADHKPDLQGVWANNIATPLERPKELAGKPVLSDAELKAFKERASRLFAGGGDAAFGDGLYLAVLANPDNYLSSDGKTGDYNQFWLVDREFENRTSLVFDPPDGRIPPRTPEAQARVAAEAQRRREHPADSAQSLSLSVRCITFGMPRLGGLNAGYNSYTEIFQTPDYVAIKNEMFHEVRIVPLDGRPHLPSNIRLWQGDTRGHWEGDTLVVDSTNFSPQTEFMGSHENLHVIERFTRTGPDTLEQSFTIEDPTTWTRPWSAMIPLHHTKEQIYEFACHEGNISLPGILAGARMDEKAAAPASSGR